MTVYRNTPHGPVVDLPATLKQSLARVKAIQAEQEKRRVFKKDDRVMYDPPLRTQGWEWRIGKLGTVTHVHDPVYDFADRTIWVKMDEESESINVYTRNLKHVVPCAVCGTECAIDETRCPKCDRDPNTQHVKCESCDGTGTIETSEYGGQYAGDVAQCEDCDGHGLITAPCLEDREAILATITKGDK